MTIAWRGQPFPLGATWDGQGTNFSLFSEHAEAVELCLFDDEDRETRVAIEHQTAHNWHSYLPGVGPRQRYGYRVYGPYAPEEGLRFNPAKLLLDPYAKAIVGEVRPDVGQRAALRAGRRQPRRRSRARRRGLGAGDAALRRRR
jgi:isoamylase